MDGDGYPQYDEDDDLSWRDDDELEQQYLDYDADEYFYDPEDDQNEIAFSEDSESNPKSDADVAD